MLEQNGLDVGQKSPFGLCCASGRAPGPLQPVGLSTEVVEALRYLMGFSADEGRLEEAEAYAMKLLDTSGPEKDREVWRGPGARLESEGQRQDEAKAMLRNLRFAVK